MSHMIATLSRLNRMSMPNRLFSVSGPDSSSLLSEVPWNKINWSAPGPDVICNYWVKKITVLQQPLGTVMGELLNKDASLPTWVNTGRASLIPKEGEWDTTNHRPITCLNTTYKLLTSLMIPEVDNHLDETGLLQNDQRRARERVSGCLDNLLIDKVVMEDSKDRRRNMTCAWIDVRKAYDSVDHS